ncbi:hypothetical protein HUS74_22085, partial [Pandoraea nosoerga]|nr:hypothetical protein [Pandoraea nosoerga]
NFVVGLVVNFVVGLVVFVILMIINFVFFPPSSLFPLSPPHEPRPAVWLAGWPIGPFFRIMGDAQPAGYTWPRPENRNPDHAATSDCR